jgi:hypothetical protein
LELFQGGGVLGNYCGPEIRMREVAVDLIIFT